MKRNYQFKQKLWLWPGESANWHFLSIPKKDGQKIRNDFGSSLKGFASIKVEVKIGQMVWKTSMFYSKPAESFILPVKAKVRRDEDISAGEEVSFSIKIL
tara:strand:+ start:323 stop:622 length:300 start_codon:yes stop_codon:yes gene_type:complete